MAIDHGDLTDKLGKIFGGFVELNTFRGTTTDDRETDLRTIYSTDPSGLLSGLTSTLDAMRTSLDGYTASLSSLVSETIIDAVETDRVLSGLDISEALTEWLRQFRNDGETFNDCPVSLALAVATGAPALVGDITFHTSSKDIDGKATDFGIPDVYLITVANDADNGGTRWGETLAVVSKADSSALLDAAYPTGTGISTTLTVTDPATNGGLVTDGGFNNYVSAAFTSWTRSAGNAAADVFRAADDLRDGALGYCLDLKSNGAATTGVTQTVTLAASTVYSLHFAVKGINAALGTAKVHVSIRRADTGAILADDQAANITTSSGTMTVLVGTGVWTHYTLDFATPTRLPSAGVYLDIRLADGTTVTTAATIATEARVDHVCLQAMPTLYDKGVRIVAYSGATEPSRDDQWEYTVTLASGTISSYFIRWLDRTIGLASRTYKFPTISGGTETILDSVIS